MLKVVFKNVYVNIQKVKPVNLVDCVFFLLSPAPLVVSDEQTDGKEETPTQQQARMSASSATRELDELMASLSDFKVQSNVSLVQKLVDPGL